MRIVTAIAGVLLVIAVAVTLAVATRYAHPVALVALLPLLGGAIAMLALRRTFAKQQADARRALELPLRGLRRRGEVCDVVAYGSPEGGAVFGARGAQMVLRVALAAEGERPACTVTVHVVEPSEAARARIGTHVVVLEHPEAPDLRALEGFLPNGQPAR